MSLDPAESRMRGNTHVRFGGAGRGNGPRETRRRAPTRPYAETVIGLYKAELIHRRGPWKTFEQMELATLEWIEWWNSRRLHSAIGDVPPAEFEAAFSGAFNENDPAPRS